MYVKEMHIEVNQSMQKIAANKTRKLRDEEIDWILSKMQERRIDALLRPAKDGSGGFEVDEMNTDAIRTLINIRTSLPALVEEPDKRYYSILPGDYRNLLSDISGIKRLCGDTPTKGVRTEKLLVLPFRKSLKTSGPYYTNVSVTINSNVEFDMTTYTQQRDTNYIGYNSTEQIYEVLDCIISELVRKGYRVYWEQFGPKFYPKSIIIVSNTALSGSITTDGNTVVGATYDFSAFTAEYDKRDIEESTNRLSATTVADNLNGTPFFESQADSPVSTLAGNRLVVYGNKTFIVTNTWVTYVRRPRKISLILGQDCELAPQEHQKICDLAVEYIKAMISDPNWEVKLKDNMIRTTL